MKSRIIIPLLLLTLLAALPSCRPSPRTMTQVSGKTVYKGMGVENVSITVYRQEPPGWQKHIETRSGYHGSFVFNAGDGNYRLVARTEIRVGTEQVSMEGTVNNFRIEGPGGRVDRVVISLQATP